jgi:hypothetical protein
MKRIQLTKYASARVDDNVSPKVIKALTVMAKKGHKMLTKETMSLEDARKLKSRKKRK